MVKNDISKTNEVSIRQILVSKLCNMKCPSMSLDELLENAVNISGKLKEIGAITPNSLNYVPSGLVRHWNSDVSWELCFLTSFGFMEVDNWKAKKPSKNYLEKVNYIFEDLDSEVKECLFEYSSN